MPAVVFVTDFFGCVMYADDILLLSASFSGLQYMLNICYKL